MSFDSKYGLVSALCLTLWLGSADTKAADCVVDPVRFNAARAQEGEAKVRAFEQLAGECPAFAILYNLGIAYYEIGAFDRAADAYQRARGRNDLEPTVLPEVNARIADSRLAAGHIGDAVCMLALAESQAGGRPSDLLSAVRDKIETDPRRDEVPVTELVEGLHCMDRARIRIAFPERVEFEFNSDRLTERGRVQTRRLGELIRVYLKDTVSATRARANLIGHADKRGSNAYNDELTRRRARSVRDWIERALPELGGRLAYEGRGKRQLRDLRDTEEAHRANRRVELQFE